MDTKLKNRRQIGVILILLIVAGAALAALGLYPYMERKAKAHEQNYHRWQEDAAVEETARQLMNSTYSIWMEVKQQEAGHLLTPTQIFLPDLKNQLEAAQKKEHGNAYLSEDGFDYQWDYSSDYYRQIQSFMDRRGQQWKDNSKSMVAQIDYELTDWLNQPLSVRKDNAAGVLIRTELRFDSTGHMAVSYDGGNAEDSLAQQLAVALNYYVGHDPVREEEGPEYLYSGLQFERPKDVVFRYWVPEDLLIDQPAESEHVPFYVLRNSAVVTGVGLMLAAVVALLALILPCFGQLYNGQAKIFRAPFEVVSYVAIIGLVVLIEADLPSYLVAATLNGNLAAEIQQMGFERTVAQGFTWVFNWLMWAIGFALVYWITTCYRAVFTLGLWRYIKERTFLGWFCCWVKRCWNRFAAELENVDLRKGPDKTILKIVLINFIAVTLLCCFWFIGIGVLVVYSVILFIIIRKYWLATKAKYDLLLNALRQVAGGNLDIEIEENLGIFEPFREELDTIQDGLKQAVDKAVKSQRMKTELITNVSHDLKTPLTAIITYVNLLKDEQISDEERSSYIAVLEQKSMRLKVLIEDLFEVSKANSNNITLHPEMVDIVNLMKQIRLELSDRITESGIDFRWDLPEEKITLMLDGQKTCRIFENLLINITKYALPGTRAYIEMKELDGEVWVSMRNISANELHVSGQELTERFVRGDEARNTEGSGLGLAIAKSFTEVQGGRFVAEAEADLFRVILIWPANQINIQQQQ